MLNFISAGSLGGSYLNICFDILPIFKFNVLISGPALWWAPYGYWTVCYLDVQVSSSFCRSAVSGLCQKLIGGKSFVLPWKRSCRFSLGEKKKRHCTRKRKTVWIVENGIRKWKLRQSCMVLNLQNNHISSSKNIIPDKSMRWMSPAFQIRSPGRKIMRQKIFYIYIKAVARKSSGK